MGLGGCYSCIKYLMFAFNFLFWILGCAILGVGIWVRVDPNFTQFVDITDEFNFLYTAAYILIGVGAVIMIIGFLGCCGAIRESQCMLALFFCSLFVIFGVLLSAGIFAIVQKETIRLGIKSLLDKSVKNYHTSDKAKNLMDLVQKKLECCGASGGAKDYPEFIKTNEPAKSCDLEFWGKPCDQKLIHLIEQNVVIIAGVAIGIGIIMILGMIFSMILCCAIREAER
eukprot:GHVU01070196.1.p1 GENE.GHVU01070196.1~~GHVU01070196.1.p1  ORF type:complete len:227 (+),score=11.32 GHVU01070196.1:314-994(+)